MNERTLSAVEVSDAIRKPSFELQQAAIAAGYASVRDYVLAEAVEEIRNLKKRVEDLEEIMFPTEPITFERFVKRFKEDDGA